MGYLDNGKNGSRPNMGTGREEVMTVIEGEIEATCLHGRRRTAWIDDVR